MTSPRASIPAVTLQKVEANIDRTIRGRCVRVGFREFVGVQKRNGDLCRGSVCGLWHDRFDQENGNAADARLYARKGPSN